MDIIARRWYNRLFRRRDAYRKVFRNTDGDGSISMSAEIVMADLRRFCNGTGSNFHIDSRQHARMEGRREVFQRIKDTINVTDKELYEFSATLEEEA